MKRKWIRNRLNVDLHGNSIDADWNDTCRDTYCDKELVIDIASRVHYHLLHQIKQFHSVRNRLSSKQRLRNTPFKCTEFVRKYTQSNDTTAEHIRHHMLHATNLSLSLYSLTLHEIDTTHARRSIESYQN